MVWWRRPTRPNHDDDGRVRMRRRIVLMIEVSKGRGMVASSDQT